MRILIYERIANLVIRVSIIISKVIFIFVLAKFLSVEDVGVFVLISSIIGYALYFIGADFYTYTNRIVIGRSSSVKKYYISRQLSFSLFSFFLGGGLLLPVFFLNYIEIKYIPVFFAILFFDLMSQELARFLLAFERTLQASIVIFVRTSSWCYLVSVSMMANENLRNIQFTLIVWAVSSCVSFLLAAYLLNIRSFLILNCRKIFDIKWYKNVFQHVYIVLLSTLSFKCVFVLDKIILLNYSDKDVVGVYSIYASIISIMISILESIVLHFSYPKLVRLNKEGRRAEFIHEAKIMMKFSCFLILAVVMPIYLLSDPIFSMFGKHEYVDNLNYFFPILGSAVFFSLSSVSHYINFSLGKDLYNLIGNGFAVFIFLIAFYILNSNVFDFLPIEALGYGMFSTSIMIFIIKSTLLLKFLKGYYE